MKLHVEPIQFHRQTETFNGSLCFSESTLEQLGQMSDDFLHPNEKLHLASLSATSCCWDYLMGRYVVKSAVSHVLADSRYSLSDIQVQRGVFRQPIVQYPGNQRIEVSLSHCRTLGVAVAGLAHHPVGVDMEWLNSESFEAIDSQLTVSERALMHRQGFSDERMGYFLFWTVKEALSKILRTGLMAPFEVYEINRLSIDGNHWRSEFKNFSQYQAMSFTLSEYMVSLVFPRKSMLTLDIPSIQSWYQTGCG